MAIRVKFLAKTPPDQDIALWTSLLPKEENLIEGVEFTFDIDARNYDWLVVYEGLPALQGEKKINRIEALACPRENTLLITTEPSSIRLDGPHFMAQFGHVLTAKAPELVRHSGQIKQTPPLRWFYGRPMGAEGGRFMTYDEMSLQAPPNKTKTLSTVCSTKQMAHTGHAKRYEFVMALKSRMPELNIFGRGIQPIDEKSEAMQDYRYHIAIENHLESGHWTEKLSDCFLAYCLPFYFGDPDYAKTFPKDSVIPIDIYNLDAAEAIISKTIAQEAYLQRLPAIIKARDIVLNEQNLMVQIARIVTRYTTHKRTNKPLHKSGPDSVKNYLYGRHTFRKKHPLKAASDAFFRAKMRSHPKASPLQISNPEEYP